MYAKAMILCKNGFCWGPIGEPQWFVGWVRFGRLETAPTAVWVLGGRFAPNCGFWRSLFVIRASDSAFIEKSRPETSGISSGGVYFAIPL